MPWRITKQLTCPACGVLIGQGTYQRFPPNLLLTGVEGGRLQPEGVQLQERRVQGEIDRAASPGEEQRARDRLAFVKSHWMELIYDLRCANGHSTLRTMPQLVQAIRDCAGQWVSLA